jgi:hypothetical protein
MMLSRLFPYLLLVFGVALRFLPHPANVAPVGALALFGGVYLSKRWAIILPLAMTVGSDALMSIPGLRTLIPWGAGNVGFHIHAPFVWLSFALVGLIGLWVRKHKSITTIFAGSLAGAVVFYLVTNWAVWAFGTMYSGTWAGLFQSYQMALPFFRNTLLGDLGYAAVFFGIYEGVAVLARLQARRGLILR